LSERGKTVVFSAHNLFHVESVCDRIIIMNRGEIIARGTVPEIRRAHGRTEYRVYVTVPVDGAEPDGAEPSPNRAASGGTEPGDDRYRLVVDDMEEVERVREEAEAAGGRVVDIRTVEPSLEDIFLDLAADAQKTPRTVGGAR
jgi:ABC-2 type transport system ATP-binding protein